MPPIPKPKPKRTKHFFKEWREKNGLTQEQAMGRLGWSQSKISRLESGNTPYNQDDLSAAAKAYNCTETDLIQVNPLKESEVVDLILLLRTTDTQTKSEIIDYLTFKLGRKAG